LAERSGFGPEAVLTETEIPHCNEPLT